MSMQTKWLDMAHGFYGQAGAGKIDAVLASEGWHVVEAAIVRTGDERHYSSDHFPMTAVVELAKE
jgi:endonuclease/exonuclease/phosphatase family metal-dependent hydrolase